MLVFLILGDSHILRRSKAGRALKSPDEPTAGTESHALRNRLDSEIAITLKVIDALAGFLDAALTQQNTK